MKEKQYSTDGFQKAGLSFVDSNDMPLQMRVENSAREEAKKVLTERREKDCRLVSMRHAVTVVKKATQLPCSAGWEERPVVQEGQRRGTEGCLLTVPCYLHSAGGSGDAGGIHTADEEPPEGGRPPVPGSPAEDRKP